MVDPPRHDTFLAFALSGLAVTGIVAFFGAGYCALGGRFEAAALSLLASAVAFGALAAVLLRR